jgi:hypothetical protein
MKTIINYKNRKPILLTAIMITFGSLFVHANSVVKGKLTDKNNQSIPYATATIIDPETMQIIQGDMTDESGKFIMENIKPGTYILSLRSVGYEANETKLIEIRNNEMINTGKIVMTDAVINLNEIVITPMVDASPSISQLN